jgi:hypothetical protein
MQQTRDPQRSLVSRVFSRPSTTSGWAAFVGEATSIGLIAFVNVVRSPQEANGDEYPVWLSNIGFAALAGLVVSTAIGLVAVIWRGERSWIVLLPTFFLSAVMALETVNMALGMFGMSG